MTEVAAAIGLQRSATRAGFTVRTLAASLLGLFAADNLLLLHFWGLSLPLTAGLIFIAGTAIWALCKRISDDLPRVSFRAFAIALVIALALFALGGEGRFFYANTDWQIRDAVLRDMATNPWPFAYDIDKTAYFLRAPLGTYLLPAMFGANAEMALLVSNSVRLALILTLGWHLFEGKRERAIGFAVFILFSGWDVVGTALYWVFGAHLSWDHLEPWNFGYQYSSHVTQAFWVPQHAIAGWACAIAFLLWRKGLAPIGFFAASIPLVAIWSPLAIMGAVPFALLAAWDVLRRRAFDANDIGIAALAVVVALPALLYLQVDAASVGMHLLRTNPLVWGLCVALEVLPFTVPLLREAESPVTDRPVVRLIQFLLLAMPVVQVGVSADFQMRASIMPLAVLSILFAQWICRLQNEKPGSSAATIYALVAVTLGAATPLLEIRRSVMNAPSPRPLCSLIGVWHKQDNMIVPYATYLAPLSKLPAPLRHVPVTAGGSDPASCWDRKWETPSHG
jgi:hypothetical protein